MTSGSLAAFLTQYLRDCRRAECAFSFASDAHHVTVGPSSLHPHFASSSDYATASLRQIQVISSFHGDCFLIWPFDPFVLERNRSINVDDSVGDASSNPRMNSLIYRPCGGSQHNGGVVESGDYWGHADSRHSCRSSTDLFDSTADLNTSRSTKDETLSRFVDRFHMILFVPTCNSSLGHFDFLAWISLIFHCLSTLPSQSQNKKNNVDINHDRDDDDQMK